MNDAVSRRSGPPIVVFRPGALGDTLVTIDALRLLRVAQPDSSIELVGNGGAAAILAAAGLVDRVTSFDGPEVTLLFANPPRVVDRWHSAGIVVIWLRGAEAIAAAFRNASAGAVLCADPEPDSGMVHMADYLIATLSRLGVSGPSSSAPLELAALTADQPTACTAIIHPGSGSATKNWAVALYVEVISVLRADGWPMALLEGPADGAAVAALQGRLAQRIETTVLSAPTPLALAHLLASHGKLLIGNDSGVSHLSARLGLPTVALFGPTDPARWSPRGPKVATLGGQGTWPSADQVLDAIRSLIPDC